MVQIKTKEFIIYIFAIALRYTDDLLIKNTILFIFWYQYFINILTYTSFVHLGFSARIKRREIIYSSSHLVLPQKIFFGYKWCYNQGMRFFYYIFAAANASQQFVMLLYKLIIYCRHFSCILESDWILKILWLDYEI